MLTRFEPTAPPTDMPAPWIDDVNKLLSNVYSTQLEAKNCKFDIVARTYEKELILAVSFVDKDDSVAIPVTYISSIDYLKDESSEKIKEKLDTLVDSVGVFFDSYFSQSDWNEYQATWQEAEFKKSKVYYVVTRENLALMVQADELLRNSLN